MDDPARHDTAHTLHAAARGDEAAAAALFDAAYEELRALAAGYFRVQPGDHTLQPTALVNEACMKILGGNAAPPRDRDHFRAIAATAMRQILVSHARARGAHKRDRARRTPLLGNEAAPATLDPADVLAVNDALDALTHEDPRKARVVELRFFGGLEHEEIARALDVSVATVERDWRFSRAWLAQRLEP